jgi:hypothetical protein
MKVSAGQLETRVRLTCTCEEEREAHWSNYICATVSNTVNSSIVQRTHSNVEQAEAFASRKAHSHSLMLSDATADHGCSLCALALPCKKE